MDEHDTKAIERNLFELNSALKGYELYEATVELVQDIVKGHIQKELWSRMEFNSRMLNWVNNAGWDDKSKHSARIQMIRDEGDVIEGIGEIYDVDVHY